MHGTQNIKTVIMDVFKGPYCLIKVNWIHEPLMKITRYKVLCMIVVLELEGIIPYV
jgi:hypothetical protein